MEAQYYKFEAKFKELLHHLLYWAHHEADTAHQAVVLSTVAILHHHNTPVAHTLSYQ